jgi:hypothetical protein
MNSLQFNFNVFYILILIFFSLLIAIEEYHSRTIPNKINFNFELHCLHLHIKGSIHFLGHFIRQIYFFILSYTFNYYFNFHPNIAILLYLVYL